MGQRLAASLYVWNNDGTYRLEEGEGFEVYIIKKNPSIVVRAYVVRPRPGNVEPQLCRDNFRQLTTTNKQCLTYLSHIVSYSSILTERCHQQLPFCELYQVSSGLSFD